MTETVTLKALSHGGDTVPVHVEIFEEPPYRLKVSREGRETREYSNFDLFACLIAARRDLESDGLLLCCQGARPDVGISGMQSQMTSGRYANEHISEPRSVRTETIDIFAPADCGQAVSVAEQRAAIMRFHGFSDRGATDPA